MSIKDFSKAKIDTPAFSVAPVFALKVRLIAYLAMIVRICTSSPSRDKRRCFVDESK